MKANAVGFLALALQIGVLTMIFVRREELLLVFLGAFVGLGICSIFLWESQKSPQTPNGWLAVAVFSVLLGAAFFAVDIWVGHALYPNLPWAKVGTLNEGLGGFGWTLILCPGLTMIAAAGAMRARFIKTNTDAAGQSEPQD